MWHKYNVCHSVSQLCTLYRCIDIVVYSWYIIHYTNLLTLNGMASVKKNIYLFTAKLLYMFRPSIAPIIRST